MSAKFLFGSVLSAAYYANSRKERKKMVWGHSLGESVNVPWIHIVQSRRCCLNMKQGHDCIHSNGTVSQQSLI